MPGFFQPFVLAWSSAECDGATRRFEGFLKVQLGLFACDWRENKEHQSDGLCQQGGSSKDTQSCKCCQVGLDAGVANQVAEVDLADV